MLSGGSSVASGDTGFKMYSIDGTPLDGQQFSTDVNTQAALLIAAAKKRDSQHNER